MPEHFADRLLRSVQRQATAAIVGIDPTIENLPPEFTPQRRDSGASCAAALEAFGCVVIDLVAPIVPAVKINVAFFEAYYEFGSAAFGRLIQYARQRELLVVADVKRGDIGSTAHLYALGQFGAAALSDVEAMRVPDAVTLAGYLGRSSVEPFIAEAQRQGRGVFILVRPSDSGADEVHEFGPGPRFYEHMAALVTSWGGRRELRGECGLSCVGAVVAPKDADSTARLRAAMPHAIWLVPGVGAQGATPEQCRPCFLHGGAGAVVNASRSVIQAFQQPHYRQQFGDDWRACIAAAARDFARQVAGTMPT
jgi:orotidine-5'-phosphate decarboxylase